MESWRQLLSYHKCIATFSVTNTFTNFNSDEQIMKTCKTMNYDTSIRKNKKTYCSYLCATNITCS